MITTLATVETDSIRDWIEVFKRASALQVAYTLQAPNATISPTRLSLKHYNVIQSSIVASDGTIVKGYRPYSDDGSKLISDVVMVAPPAPGTTFNYSTTKVTFRSPLNPYPELSPPLPSPRLIVLHGGTTSARGRRQVNDNGDRVVTQNCMMTILIDSDDENGGPTERNNLMGIARQVIEQSLDFLFDQGYEDVVIEQGKLDIPSKEGVPTLYRGVLMVSSKIYPTVWDIP